MDFGFYIVYFESFVHGLWISSFIKKNLELKIWTLVYKPYYGFIEKTNGLNFVSFRSV